MSCSGGCVRSLWTSCHACWVNNRAGLVTERWHGAAGLRRRVISSRRWWMACGEESALPASLLKLSEICFFFFFALWSSPEIHFLWSCRTLAQRFCYVYEKVLAKQASCRDLFFLFSVYPFIRDTLPRIMLLNTSSCAINVQFLLKLFQWVADPTFQTFWKLSLAEACFWYYFKIKI